MSDLELLYILLVAFYVWECACWVPHGGLAFVRWWGSRSRVAALVGNQHGGFALGQPFPFLGNLFVAAQLPLSLSPDGVLGFVAATVNPAGRSMQTGRFKRWQDISSIEARRKSVRINGDLFARAQSGTHARWLAEELRCLARLTPDQRPDAIARLIRSAFDAARLEERLAELRCRARAVRGFCNALWLLVFLAAPALSWHYGLVRIWLPLLIAVFALSGTLAVLFHRAHRRLYPAAEDERFAQFLMVLLFPPAAIRAGDLLSRPLLESFHPLAAASVLSSAPAFSSLAKRLLLDLRHPALPLATAGKPELAAVEEWFRARTLAAAEEAVRHANLAPADITRPPVPADPSCRAYCPRCQAQFTRTDAACAECGGLPVQAFGD